jgi:sugar lactone lactonase YvrE
MFSSDPQHIRVFDMVYGKPRNGRIFHKVSAGCADGIRVDGDGNLWSSAGDGVHCIAPDGTLYASDPNWKAGTGQLWRMTADGRTHREAAGMGTTNGIEVSPDGRTVYVNESVQRNVWAFDRAADGSLGNKRLLRKFDDFGFDGMRCDVDGNLYVTRHGKGTVVKLSPTGEILREIDVLGPHPTNICFGGPDGCTAYVTEAKEKRLVQFRVDRPGLEWSRWTR